MPALRTFILEAGAGIAGLVMALNAQCLPAAAQNNSAYPTYQAQPVQQAPNSYPYQTGQPVIQPRAGVGRILDDVKGLVKDFVQVDSQPGSPVHVRAPFVNVDVNPGQSNVHVKAPFVNVQTDGNKPVSVTAPFTNIGGGSQASTPAPSNMTAAPLFTPPPVNGVNVQAPFTNVQTMPEGSSNINVHAPFTHIQKNGNTNGVSVQAPFTNVQTGK